MTAARSRDGERKETAIHIRASQRQRALIDRAADAVDKTRSDFMIEAACREANAVLLDRRFFLLSQKDYQRFLKELDRPAVVNPRIQRLLATRAPWEK